MELIRNKKHYKEIDLLHREMYLTPKWFFFGLFQDAQFMTKRVRAKYKIDRRMGENIWGRPKSPVNLRAYGPGQHGQQRRGKLSDFGLQMRAKQKLKGYYGNITEKQFKKIFK